MLRTHPVDHTFHFTAIRRIFTQRLCVVRTEDGRDVTFRIFLYALGFDHIGVTKTHFFAQHQTLVLLVRFFAEVGAIDPDFTAERHVAGAHFRFVRMVRHRDLFASALRIVFDNQFHWIDHCHRARRVFVQVFANAGFQRRHFDGVVLLGNANTFAELTNGRRGVATTTQARDGRHTRVVPAFNVLVGDQQVQLTLGHHGVFQVQTRELVLTRMHRNGDVIQHPVVQTTVVLEFQRAQRVRNAFQRIADAVGEVVHRVDAPLVTGLVVFSELNAVQHRIAHHDERRRHIDFGTQTRFTFFEATGTHFFKQRQVLFHATIAERAVFTRLSQRTAVFTDFVSRQFVDVCQTFVNQFNRVGIQLIEIV